MELALIYRRIAGTHCITPSIVDGVPVVSGLYAMHSDFYKAVKSACEAIPILLKDNHGIVVEDVEWDASEAAAFAALTEDTPDYKSDASGQRLLFRAVVPAHTA